MAQSHKEQTGIVYWTNGTGSDVSSGDVVDLGGRIAIALVDIANGSSGNVATKGIYKLAKDTSTITQEAVVYWDVSESKITTTQGSGDPRAGVAVLAAATGVSYVEVDINAPETAGRDSITYPASGEGDATANQTAISTLISKLQAAGILAKA